MHNNPCGSNEVLLEMELPQAYFELHSRVKLKLAWPTHHSIGFASIALEGSCSECYSISTKMQTLGELRIRDTAHVASLTRASYSSR